ncbi:MAG: protein kinase domain-containing protein [Deltaproteobacteria bacterium]
MARVLTKAGRYQIVSELGRGSMGVVYQGFDPLIGRTVAIKTMLIEGLSSTEFQEYKARFQREAQAAGILAHPNIVTVYDFGEDEGVLYLAMEFLQGDSLQDLVEKQNILPVETIIPIFEQVCSALDHAHKNNIVHRDIKPANIMILNSGLVKVTDFGIAKIMSMGMTQAGQILGTPNYMSPEQVKGRTVDGRSDIFALGVILYELVTGEKPFGGQNITTVIYKIINENPIPPRELDSTIHQGLSFVISKALAKAPEERFQTCRELAEALKNYRTMGAEPPPSATVVIKVPPIQAPPVELPAPSYQAPASAPTRQTAPPALKRTRAPEIEPLAGEVGQVPLSRPAREQAPPAPAPQPAVRPPAFATVKPPAKGTSPVVWTLLALLLIGGAGGGAYYFLVMNKAGTNPAQSAPTQNTPNTSAETPSSPAGGTETATQPGETQPGAGQTTATGQPAGGAQPLTPTEVATKPEAKSSETSSRRETLAPAEGAPKTTPGLLYGKLFVNSAPSGAQITVDGHSEPDWVTPRTIDELKGGDHRVTLSAQGYSSSAQTVTVDPGRTITVNLTLSPFNAPGGQTHATKPVSAPPARTQENPATPPATTTTPATASGNAILGVKTGIAGAEIFIDGKLVGTSPVSVTLPAGEHTYTLKIKGAEIYSGTVKLAPGDVKGVQIGSGN